MTPAAISLRAITEGLSFEPSISISASAPFASCLALKAATSVN